MRRGLLVEILEHLEGLESERITIAPTTPADVGYATELFVRNTELKSKLRKVVSTCGFAPVDPDKGRAAWLIEGEEQ